MWLPLCAGIFHSHDLNTSHYPPLIWLHPLESDVPLVQPEWYAMLFWTLATANHARIVTTAVTSTNPFIKVWSAIDAAGVIRIAILHKDLNASAPAAVSLDLSASLSAFPRAAVLRLLAPSPRSTYGLRIAGLTFDGTEDGRPSGDVDVEYVDASSAGVYEVDASPISLVLVMIDPQQRPFTPHFDYHRTNRRTTPRSKSAAQA